MSPFFWSRNLVWESEYKLQVIPGAALPDWLLQGEPKEVRDKFHPVPHMVPHLQHKGYQRAVFARMMVAPADAIPKGDNEIPNPVAFEEVFMRQNRGPIQ